jgi:uncharacterized membrane protein YdjX (TVP38/TMEM64 family)
MKTFSTTQVYVAALLFFIIAATGASLYAVYLAESGESQRMAMFMDNIRAMISGYGKLAPIAFIIAYIIFSFFLLPVLLLTLMASVLFPAGDAAVYCVTGVFLGSLLPFVLARTLLHKQVERFVHARYRKYDDLLNHMDFWNITLLRLLPVMPYEIFNYLAGVSRAKPHKYVIATFIGILPGTLVYVLFFSSIGEILSAGISLRALTNFKLGLFLGFNIIVYGLTLGMLYYRYRIRKRPVRPRHCRH